MKKETKNFNEQATEEIRNMISSDITNSDKETMDLLSIGLDLGKFKLTQLDLSVIDKNNIRYLVDTYYQIQAMRTATENQLRAIQQGKDGEGMEASAFISTQIRTIEATIKKIIDFYTDKIPVCYWAKKNMGIGPMISAGLYARLDINKATSAGSFWSYCGLNDNKTPWLGKEKSAVIIKETMAATLEDPKTKWVFDGLSKVIKKDRSFKKTFDNFFKGIFENAEINDDIVDEKIVFDAITKDLNFTDTIIEKMGNIPLYNTAIALCKLYDTNMVLDCEIQSISINEKVNRKPSQLFAGALTQWNTRRNKSSKVLRYIKKDDLEKFMAKPPFNRELKKLCYNIGQCLIKNSNKEDSLYGRLYKERKAYETLKNENLDYADQAAALLKENNYKDKETKETLESGKLTKGHINMRAMRYAVKMFLSHYYEMWYLSENGSTPRTPWVLATTDKNMDIHKDYVYPYVKYEDVLEHFNLTIPEKVYPTLD